METDLLTTGTYMAVVAVAVFVCLLAGIFFLRWILEEWRLAGPRAIERMRKHLARVQQRRRYQEQVSEIQEDAELAAFGSRLMAEMSDSFFHNAHSVFGQLRTVRTALGSYGTVCLRTLQCLAASCEGLPQSPYEFADLAPERRKAQLQVVAVAAAGLRILEETNNEILFDSSLIVWNLNLRKIRHEICPNCPVVSAPEIYLNACPVMTMACEVRRHNENEQTQPKNTV